MSIGNKFYGKHSVDIVGRDTWDQHDTTRTWTDGGAVEEALKSSLSALLPQLGKIVSDNATLAVSDYISSAEAGLRSTPSGEVIIGLRLSNAEAAMIVEIPLRKLIVGALSEMRPTLGIDKEAQATLSGLVALGNALVNLTKRDGQTPPPAHAPIGHNVNAKPGIIRP